MKAYVLALFSLVFIVSLSGAAQVGGPVKPVVGNKAQPLPLTDVRLTGGPLKHAQDLDAKYLLELEPDRMMALLRKRAGLEPKAQPYGGWDGDGRQLTGHIAGHYLSAVSLMWAATGDPRFKERADYLAKELKEVQNKRGDGYIGAQMDGKGVDGRELFRQLSNGTIRSGGFDLNCLWSPWYVLHKIYAGLRDAYRLTGNRTALEVEIKYAAWAESILSKLNEDQVQRMLNTEFGGMNEIMVDLYADTGDKRWLAVADKFEHKSIIEPLARGEDILAGKHGNTLVPKLLGALVRYEYTGSAPDGAAAKFFWDEVALHHSFATGGHGRNEYFGPPDKLDPVIEGRTAETCNVYNMIKMARALFALQPEIRYADFHERALFNHILGSMDPADGATCYMVPVGQGVAREYADMFESFTCCVGSGMESHALHGYGLYYESADKLWVNLYAPSTAKWQAVGADLTMETSFPEGDTASLKLTLKSPKKFTLALRRPYWAGEGFSVKLNGKLVKNLPPPDSYVEIKRSWKTGDVVDLVLPKTLRTQSLPDNPSRVALMWGPLVLAGDLGPMPQRGRGRREQGERRPERPTIPVFVVEQKSLENWLKPVAGQPGNFHSDGVGRDRDVDFTPFYRLHRRTYGAYWDVFTPAMWEQKAAEVLAQQEKQRKLEVITVAFAQPGQMQTERDFNQQGENSTPAQLEGRYGRRAGNWFSFDLAVDPAHPMTLIATYNRQERANRSFTILIDGLKLADQTIERVSPQERSAFVDVEYKIPPELVQGKQKVTVRFQAAPGSEVAAVYGIRMIRGDAER